MKFGVIISGMAFGVVCGFLLPICDFLLFTFFVVVVDWLTGWRASGMPIQSKGIRKSFEKLTFYMLGIMLAHGFDLVYLAENMYITQMIAGIVALTELISVYENIDKKTGSRLSSAIKKYFSKNGDSWE